ncbi:MAG: cupin domain-containing protein [Hyphomicrobiaceae bacterium]
MPKVLLATSALALAALVGTSLAQQPATPTAPLPITQQGQGLKRIPLQKFDVPGTALETVIGIAEIAPNFSVGRHSHPGVESGYIMEGEATLLVEGQPPRELKAGDSYVVPAGVIHDAKAGPKGAKAIATYVVEKGKPFAVPAAK